MAQSDFVPRPDAEFNLFQANLVAIVQPKLAAWSIPPAQFNPLLPLKTTWETKFGIASNKDNRTRADVKAKDDARTAYEKPLRKFIASYLSKNPKIPDSDKEMMGLNVPDGHHTPVPVPASRPLGKVNTSNRLQHIIGFSDENTPTSKAKPKGVRGCQIWMKIGGVAPADASELRYIATDTRTPYTLDFAGADAGKMAYYWLRWENTKGQTGPWSEPVSATVVG